MTYDVDYFIKKFEAIPEEKWITCTYITDTACCALGHCGAKNDSETTAEANGLKRLFGYQPYYPQRVNDGMINSYNQPTPKQRILAALYDIKKLNHGTEPSTERRNEVQSELPYVDQTKTFTQLIKVVEETSDCEIKITSD